MRVLLRIFTGERGDQHEGSLVSNAMSAESKVPQVQATGKKKP
jgi:hypothetical protein